jgi:hypothetical protein
VSAVPSPNDATACAARQRRRRISPPLIAFGLVLLGWWLMGALVIGTDPYNIYPWGLSPTVRNAEYGEGAVLYLVDVVAKDPSIDTVLIGGSTTMPITNRMMENILPQTHHAFNLSYQGPRNFDRKRVMGEIAANSHAKRVILSLDWIYVSSVEGERPGFPDYLYDGNPRNDLQTLNRDGLRLAVQTLLNEPLWLNKWDYSSYTRSIERDYRSFQQPQVMKTLAAAIEAHKKDVALPSGKSCADFNTIADQLVPFAKNLSQRHSALDLYFPPMSLSLYYAWADLPKQLRANKETFTADYLTFQRCLVKAVAGIEGVRIFSFDNEDWLTGDMKNYFEPAHMFGDKNFEYVVRAIAQGSHQLTPENVDENMETLRRRILTYRLRNTNFRDVYASDR